MNSDRLEQIDQVFQSALDLPPELRADFLEVECRGDAQLRAEVESLLSAHQQAGDFIEDSASDVAASLLQKQPQRPRQVGQYRIEKLIGAGGMGEVYLGVDRMGRKVALKLLAARLIRDQQHVARFLQEARAVLALNHPNIVTVYDIGEADGTYYIASELIEGETLGACLEKRELELSDVLEISIQIATALAAAHEKGIVHRDVKPDNVMVRSDGYVKVLDFGIAKLTEDFAEPVSTESPTRPKLQTAEGIVIGTASYMSPEQARGLRVDARADIWSCGVMLFEMLAGQTPFPGDSAAEVVAHILEREPAPLSRYVRNAPAELQRIVSKALTKNRDERYQTTKDMLLDLKALKQEMEFAAKLERLSVPGEAAAYQTGRGSAESSNPPELIAASSTSTRPVSSAEYIVTEIKQHKRGALIAFLLLLLAAIALGVWSVAHRSASSAQIKSIAVLPFTNESGNPEVEYLSDGVTESLINRMSQLPGLKVIARSSSFKYKGKQVDPQEVARSLGVEAIMTGRVLQRGDNLIISAELVDARDGTQVWGEQYNRKASDLLLVQADISREIAETLRLRLTAGERQQLAKRETVNPQAYELLLKGRFARSKGGRENGKKAIEYFNQAIAVDPAYAVAYAELSGSYASLVTASALDPKEFTPKADGLARKALELDENLADAHLALARIKLIAWDWAEAEREFKRAIELNPNLAGARAMYSLYLILTGRHDEAIAEVKHARELDPLSPSINVAVANRLLLARQNDAAIEAAKKALELDQNFPGAHVHLGYIYAAKAQYPEAIAAYQEGIKLGGDSPDTQIYLGAAYALAGEREQARAILKRLEAKEYVSPGALAALYVALGEREKAFASLERAYAEHDAQLQFLRVDPNLDPLRSDPRFQDLLRRVGVTQ